MLTRPPSLPSCSSRSANQLQTHEHGYILLFALGLMAVLATLVLSVTVTLRLDAQLLSREKTALQEVYLLRGAAQYTALQLGITSAVTTLSPPLSNEARRQWILWRPNEQTYEANLGYPMPTCYRYRSGNDFFCYWDHPHQKRQRGSQRKSWKCGNS